MNKRDSYSALFEAAERFSRYLSQEKPLTHITHDVRQRKNVELTLSVIECHTLAHIHADPTITATKIADSEGYTRGAMSKILGRLENKGLLIISSKDSNRKERALTLTPLGMEVVNIHAQHHEKVQQNHIAFLDTYTDDEIAFITRFFTDIVRHTEQTEENTSTRFHTQ